MTTEQPAARLPGVTYAISNTGPLILAFQSDSFTLLTQIFAQIHLSEICAAELMKHGWEAEMKTAAPKLVIVELTAEEQKQARHLAGQIAKNSERTAAGTEKHLGETQAIVLALRPEYQGDLLLLDELEARAMTRQLRIKLSGFPGILLLAVQIGLISAEELKAKREQCRTQGTHYGSLFIQQVYEMSQQKGRRQS